MNSRRIIYAFLSTTALYGGQAIAQNSLSPERPILDANGVDMATGTIQATSKSIAIGSLAFNDIWSGPVNETTFTNLVMDTYFFIVVYVDGSSFRFFRDNDGHYVPQLANGAVLTTNGNGDYVYTAPGGARYEFVRSVAGTVGMIQSHIGTNTSYARLNRIVYANGETRTWNYRIVETRTGNCTPNRFGTVGPDCETTTYQRAQSVTTNTGLMLKASYVSNTPGANYNKLIGVMAVNRGIDHCDPDADQCVGLTQNWPTLSVLTTTDNAGLIQKTFSSPSGEFLAKIGNSGPVSINGDGVGNDDLVISYYSDGRIQQIIRNGRTSGYTYAQSGDQLTTTVTQPGNVSETFVVTLGTTRLDSKVDALGRAINFEYDAQGRLYKTTYPEGNQLIVAYDAQGRVVERRSRAKPGSALADIVETFGFAPNCTVETLKACMAPLWRVDPRGNRTDFTYGVDHGEVVRIEAPSPTGGAPRPRTDFTYSPLYAKIRNASGQLVDGPSPVWKLTGVTICATATICSGSASETKVTIGYGVANGGINLLPTQIVSAAGDGSISSTVGYAYDLSDNLVAIDGPLPGSDDTTHFFWDADRRSTGEIGPDPDGSGPQPRQATRRVYDGDRLIMREFGTVTGADANALAGMVVAQTVASTFDANAYLLRDVTSAGGVDYALNQYSYDSLGRLECAAQRMNPAAYGALPASACTLGTAGGMGDDRITRAAYDAAGQVTSIVSGYGTAAQAVDASQSYTPNGQLATVTDGENNRTSYIYDGFDRLSVTRYPVGSAGAQSSSGTDYEALSYDPASNVVSRRLRDGQSIGHSYDALGRRVYDDYPNIHMTEHDITYSYDLMGRVTRAQDASGWFGAFEYDALGRRTRQYSNLSSNTFQHDAAGRMIRQTWADGFFVTYEHRVTGEVSAVRENGGFLLASYGYDALGRRANLTRGNGTVTHYGYNAASQLQTLVQDLGGSAHDLTLGFTYNAAGQIAETTRSNDAYAWTRHYNIDRPYTANGLNQYVLAGSIAPTYDPRGNVTSAGSDSYVYNSRNQLSMKNGQQFYTGPIGLLGQIPGMNFDYVGADLATEIDGSGIRRRYVHGPGTDEPLVWYEGSGTGDRRWLHADERGSVIAVSDGGGNTLGINSYDEYGIPGVNNLGRFQYTGQKWIAELGMYDYKARTYSPTLGRFMQTDPIGYGDGLNWYNYVGGDPVNFSDPTGLAEGCTGDDFIRGGGECVVRGKAKQPDGGGGGGIPSWYWSTPRGGGSGPSWRGGGGGGTVPADGGSPTPQKVEPKSTWDKVKACTAAQYGFGDGDTPTGLDLGKAVSELGSLPVFKPLVGIPVIGESSSFTNVVNYTSFKLGLNTRFSGAAVRSFTKAAFGSVRVATVLGRANVVVGSALLAYDAASIAICTNRE